MPLRKRLDEVDEGSSSVPESRCERGRKKRFLSVERVVSCWREGGRKEGEFTKHKNKRRKM